MTTPPAPGSSTCAAISSGESGRSTTAKISPARCSIMSPLASAVERPAARTATTHRGKEAQLVVGAETMVGLDVIVTDGEQRVGAVAGEIGMPGDDRLPGGFDRSALGDVHVQPLLPGSLSVAGEETDADPHVLRLRSGGTDRSRRTT